MCQLYFPNEEKHRESLALIPKLRQAHGFLSLTTSWTFPRPDEVLAPSYYLLSKESETVYVREPALSAYALVLEDWKNRVEIRESHKYVSIRTIQKQKEDITPDIQTWMSRFTDDEESRNIFSVMLESFGGLRRTLSNTEVREELLDRLAHLFDLPKYWMIL